MLVTDGVAVYIFRPDAVNCHAVGEPGIVLVACVSVWPLTLRAYIDGNTQGLCSNYLLIMLIFLKSYALYYFGH